MNTKPILRLVMALNVLTMLSMGLLVAMPGNVFLRPLYNSQDSTFVLPRLLAGVVVVLLCAWRLYRTTQPQKTNLTALIVFVCLGLAASLVVFYGESCCDTPVFVLAGFPWSWLDGMTQAQHYLPVPLIEYLPKNLGAIHWQLDGWALWMDILAWAGLYLSFNRSRQRKVGMV